MIGLELKVLAKDTEEALSDAVTLANLAAKDEDAAATALSSSSVLLPPTAAAGHEGHACVR